MNENIIETATKILKAIGKYHSNGIISHDLLVTKISMTSDEFLDSLSRNKVENLIFKTKTYLKMGYSNIQLYNPENYTSAIEYLWKEDYILVYNNNIKLTTKGLKFIAKNGFLVFLKSKIGKIIEWINLLLNCISFLLL